MATDQLVLEIPGWEPLSVDPTPAMKAGTQRVLQHSWCGAVVIVPSPARAHLGDCPACDRPTDGWWEQRLPVAGVSAPDRKAS
ncbi:hypothetical protein GON03_19230 [Nocardioides sp. MAH-18]|uniref:Uncharacterized protein n=1 Tax=Nocardioides agri TaxID=2682843 RepID=A0A6L6XW81_9ACTN|nr:MULTISPECIES: hypothetical protein [unclassified Nocardioides]MBA2952152.1 hypothetical protein [Nocardioides sp. CGMCC 1.13656]MVQ51318.1 hypothetical protein [Nocardioides sp. MAH-18]